MEAVCGERDAFWVERWDFDSVVRVGKEEELDEFGIIMMVLVNGQEYSIVLCGISNLQQHMRHRQILKG